jgi:glycolate oxidase FAD binding subunit
LAQIGGQVLAPEDAESFWLGLRDQTRPFLQQCPLWRVVLPPQAPVLNLGPTLHEWQGGLRWLAGPQDADALRARVQALGGSACLYRRGDVPAAVPAFHPLAAGILQIHQRLKQEFDPAGVFNRHRLVPEF